MIDWDKVRKSRMIRKRGTDDDKDVLKTLAPLWRNRFKPASSKADLREQASQAWIDWQARQKTCSSSLAAPTNISSA